MISIKLEQGRFSKIAFQYSSRFFDNLQTKIANINHIGWCDMKSRLIICVYFNCAMNDWWVIKRNVRCRHSHWKHLIMPVKNNQRFVSQRPVWAVFKLKFHSEFFFLIGNFVSFLMVSFIFLCKLYFFQNWRNTEVSPKWPSASHVSLNFSAAINRTVKINTDF